MKTLLSMQPYRGAYWIGWVILPAVALLVAGAAAASSPRIRRENPHANGARTAQTRRFRRIFAMASAMLNLKNAATDRGEKDVCRWPGSSLEVL